MQDNENNILHERPMFFLKVDSTLSNYHAVVNGVIVHKDFSGLHFSTQIPVTQWMKSGKNTVELHAVPESRDDTPLDKAKISISLLVLNMVGAETVEYVIADLVHSTDGDEIGFPALGSSPPGKLNSRYGFLPDDEGDVIRHPFTTKRLKEMPGAHKISIDIELPSNLPDWKFFESDHIGFVNDFSEDDYSSVRQQLAPVYRRIQLAILSDNIETVMPLFEERNAEYEKAFYLPKGSYAEKLKSSFQRAASIPGLQPLAMDDKYLRADSPYGGQIVRLERASGRPAITFNFEEGGSISYDIWFRKERGRWVITR